MMSWEVARTDKAHWLLEKTVQTSTNIAHRYGYSAQ